MIKILYFIVTLYVSMLVLLFIFQRNLTYFPSSSSPFGNEEYDQFKAFEIKSHDGLILKSWRAQGIQHKKTFVFFHGNAGNAVDRMPMMKVLLDNGHPVILAEYRGYGINPGSPTEVDNIKDGSALIDQLLSGGLEEKDIILVGRSLGSGIASQLAVKYNISALVLISPFSSIHDIASSKYPYFPIRLMMKDKYDSIGIINKINAPLLIFHGENDKIIPISFGRALFDAANKEKAFFPIKASGHNNLNMNAINSIILENLIINID